MTPDDRALMKLLLERVFEREQRLEVIIQLAFAESTMLRQDLHRVQAHLLIMKREAGEAGDPMPADEFPIVVN